MASNTIMASIVDRLPAFALPFVTRSLRGGRGRRFAALSFGLAALTLLMSLWIGLGQGRGAHDARIELGIERSPHMREIEEFVILRHPSLDSGASLESRQARAAEHAQMTVRSAAEQTPPLDEHLELHARARALASSWDPSEPTTNVFTWHNLHDVNRLTKIVEHGGVPPIVDYISNTGSRIALQLLGMFTGGLLILLLGVAAPLLVALQQATERHENTLQPLTGTGLRARELVVGMACGPLAIVAIFAAPIAALFVFAALATNAFGSLVLLPVLVGTAIGVVFGAQLLAHLIGARRAPGLIAVGLLCLLGLVGLAGFGAGSNLEHGVFGVTAVLPHAGLVALLGDGFGQPWRMAVTHVMRPSNVDPELVEFLAPMLIGSLGAALLGLLALAAMTRHIEGRDTLLQFSQAMFGALVCVVMINVALPSLDDAEPFHQVVGLPLLSLPFLLLIMARVPVGDLPIKLRKIPMTRLIGEFAGWTLLHMIVAATLDGTAMGFHPLAMIGISWCVLVLVLLAIRVVATPGGILGHAWALICLGMLPVSYGLASSWLFDSSTFVTIAAELPGMTALWIAMLLWVPISLIRHLRRHAGRLA